MADESSKTRAVRPADFASRYLAGKVIDIGCGPDLIVPHAEPFDQQHGDAQHIASLRVHGDYDAVCSSHCLEHMRDVPAALSGWWALVKPGGHLITVVPDEDLYEQGGWPSLFNSDHKATFRFGKDKSWSPVSHDILALISALPGCEIVSVQRQDQGYDRTIMKSRISGLGRFLYLVKLKLLGLAGGVGMRGPRLQNTLDKTLFVIGVPIDQTAGKALAQIEIIARKRV